jgi:type VI secretion system secreted protein Hcp
MVGRYFHPFRHNHLAETKVENKLSIGSATGGAGAGKASFNPIEIVHAVGPASPGLFLILCMGGHFDTVSFEFVGAGGAPGQSKLLYVINCKMVAISKIEQAITDGDDTLAETITLQCGAIQVSYMPSDAKAASQSPSMWSSIRNTNSFEV